MEHRTYYVLYCAIIVSLGGFVFGFDAAVISGVVGFVSVEFDLTPIQSGFVVAAPTLSGVFGTLVIGPLSDALGRKKVLIIIAFLYLLSALASAFASSYIMLVTARALGGLAFTSLMIAPMYIAEIAPAKLRGKLVSINQLNIVVGLSAAYFANYFILNASESGSAWATAWAIDTDTWRWMLGVEIIPAAVFFFALFMTYVSMKMLFAKTPASASKHVGSRLSPR